MPQCSHHVTGSLPDCSTVTEVDPTCGKKCTGNASLTYSSDKHKATSNYSVSGEKALQTELSTNGPITVAFTVYADFVS